MKEIDNLEADTWAWDFIGAILSAGIITWPMLRSIPTREIYNGVPLFPVMLFIAFVLIAAAFSIWKSSFRKKWGWALIASVSSMITGIIFFIFGMVRNASLSVDDKNYDGPLSTFVFVSIFVGYCLTISLVIMAIVHYIGRYFKRRD